MEMTEEYYAKHVTGYWFDPRNKKRIEVFAITYEMSQKPNREKILTMELLKDYSNAGEFKYNDESRIKDEGNLCVYPLIQVGTVSRRDITENL
jgi:hypothetical protein